MIIFKKSVVVALTVSFVIALVLWLGATVNNQFVANRDASYVPLLVKVQHWGVDRANLMFPCQDKTSNTGCEGYKTAPVTILVNMLVYFAVLIIPIHLIRRYSTTLDT